jgi:hypothetical protein
MSCIGRTGEVRSTKNVTPSRSSIARTADSCRRHASAQMIVKPVAIAGICGPVKASAPAATTQISIGHRRLAIVVPGRMSGIIVAALASASSRAIGGLTSWRRPMKLPISVARTHQPTA